MADKESLQPAPVQKPELRTLGAVSANHSLGEIGGNAIGQFVHVEGWAYVFPGSQDAEYLNLLTADKIGSSLGFLTLDGFRNSTNRPYLWSLLTQVTEKDDIGATKALAEKVSNMHVVEGTWGQPKTKKGHEQNTFTFKDGKRWRKYIFTSGEHGDRVEERSRLGKKRPVEGVLADQQLIGPYFRFPANGERKGRILVRNQPAPKK